MLGELTWRERWAVQETPASQTSERERAPGDEVAVGWVWWAGDGNDRHQSRQVRDTDAPDVNEYILKVILVMLF